MGMFDYVHCHGGVLPPGSPTDGWQTQSTECQMNTYAIRAPTQPRSPADQPSGSLWHWHSARLGVPAGSFSKRHRQTEIYACGWVFMENFTGDFVFYTMCPTDDDGAPPYYVWTQYSAYFRYGLLSRLSQQQEKCRYVT